MFSFSRYCQSWFQSDYTILHPILVALHDFFFFILFLLFQRNLNFSDECIVLSHCGSPEVENGNPLQYSCLEHSMDREEPGGLQSMGSQSQTRLSIHALWFYFSFSSWLMLDTFLMFIGHLNILFFELIVEFYYFFSVGLSAFFWLICEEFFIHSV